MSPYGDAWWSGDDVNRILYFSLTMIQFCNKPIRRPAQYKFSSLRCVLMLWKSGAKIHQILYLYKFKKIKQISIFPCSLYLLLASVACFRKKNFLLMECGLSISCIDIIGLSFHFINRVY